MNQVSISHKTIIFTVVFILSLWFLYQIRAIIVLIFIAYLLMTALKPLVELFEKIKIPRTLSVILSFIIFLGIISLLLSSIIPALIEQISFLTIFAQNQLKTLHIPNFEIDKNFISSQLQTISGSFVNILKFLTGTASNLLTIFSLFVLTFYLLIERKNLNSYLHYFINNEEKEKRAKTLVFNIEKKLGGWVRGEFTLMFIVGFLTYIGLILLSIPFALPLAIIAGLLELVPNLGPSIAAIPTILMGLTISPALGIGALILAITVQQLENNIIVPLVMREAVGLKPMVTLLCLMIGVTIGGIGGAILAVPIFITLQTIYLHFYPHKK